MKVVLDVNVLVAAAISGVGAPAQLIRAWQIGSFELVVSPALMTELAQVLQYPKLVRRITPSDSADLLNLVRAEAAMYADPEEMPSTLSRDAADNYLIALADYSQALLVSGDKDLLSLSDARRIMSPAEFYAFLQESDLV